MKANYKYVCEDQDELEFENGEIIQVIEFDEPDEQVCLFKLHLTLAGANDVVSALVSFPVTRRLNSG